MNTEDAYAVDAVEESFTKEFATPQAPRKYKIAMFAWESLHAVAVGGVAPHLTNLSAGLARRGHEVHAFVRNGGGMQRYDYIDGVHVHRITFGQNNDFVIEIRDMVRCVTCR